MQAGSTSPCAWARTHIKGYSRWMKKQTGNQNKNMHGGAQNFWMKCKSKSQPPIKIFTTL